MEKAATLPKKFESDTNSGVRCLTRRRGITGNGAHRDSTVTKKAQDTTLATRRPQMSGCDHGNSSVDFKLRPRRRQPTVDTRVSEPRPSMRRSFARSGWLSISAGSLMLTLAITSMKENRRIGIYHGRRRVNMGSGGRRGGERLQLTWSKNAARLRL